MLARYQMKRGTPAAELPSGVRQDSRKHTRHPLRPPAELVAEFLKDPSAQSFERFRAGYRESILAQYGKEPEQFDGLAALARVEDVFLGCSCPTKKNPDVRHCHTWLALELMSELYDDLEVRFPG